MFEIIVQSDGPRHRPGDPGRCVVVCVAGELDIATAPELRDALSGAIDGGASEVVVDGSDVEFIDASGVRVLLAMTETARMSGGSLRVRRPSRPMQRVFDLLQLDGSLPIEG